MNLWWIHINKVNNVTKLIMRNTTVWQIHRCVVSGSSADKHVVADTIERGK